MSTFTTVYGCHQIQDFMEPMYEGIRRFAESGERGLPTEYEIIEGLQNPEKSNSIVVVSLIIEIQVRTPARA